jgi:hypothetical protein
VLSEALGSLKVSDENIDRLFEVNQETLIKVIMHTNSVCRKALAEAEAIK